MDGGGYIRGLFSVIFLLFLVFGPSFETQQAPLSISGLILLVGSVFMLLESVYSKFYRHRPPKTSEVYNVYNLFTIDYFIHKKLVRNSY